MPIAFLILGVAVAVAAYRNTHKQLGTLLAGEFTGQGNFLFWIAAIFIIGMIGYIPKLRGPSHALLALILIALFLANKGFFANFTAALSTPQPAAVGDIEPKAPGPLTIQLTGGESGTGSSIGGVVGGVVGKVVGGALLA